MASQGDGGKGEDGYMLGRNYRASARLALLHLLITRQFGFLLHPSIADALPSTSSSSKEEGLRVADVGTGTGIWLGELSRELPLSTQFDGFDIADAQFPPQEWYGPNTRLSKLDIFKPLPEELVGKYDVVHLRFFMTIVQDARIGVVVENLKRMLKPGGYLQWVERDWLSKFPKTATEKDDPHTQVTAYLRKYFTDVDWINKLPAHFSDAGLEVLAHVHEPPLPIYRKPWNEDNLIGWEELGDSIKDDGEKAWYRDMHARCAAEAAKGWYVDFELVICTARKPK